MTTTNACPQCGTPVTAGNNFCSKCGADVTGPAAAATTKMTSMHPQLSVQELLQHATVGEFEILRELGRGGMAMVFLAHDLSLNRKVALKVMSPNLGNDDSMAERFVREAQTAASLSHPNIIPVYAVKHHELVTFFVMKFIPGRPLDDIMSELGPMPFEMVSAILQQVAGALGYGHRRGVVHRDVKPGNVMIDEEGWAIVTDFGIAKVDTAEGLTRTGAAIGTPTYMSPEQCTAKEVTGASDQYSLGVVAYEMLTGRKPFEGESVMAIMYGHVHEELPDLRSLRPDCPNNLYEVVGRMLAKAPAARFPSMDDVVSTLEAGPLAHDHPVRTQMMTLAAEGLSAKLMKQIVTPRSPIPRARTAPERTPAPVSGLGTAGPTTPAWEGSTPPPAPLTSPGPRPGTLVGAPRKQSRKGLRYVVGGVVGVGVAGAVVFLGPWNQSEGASATAGETPTVVDPGPIGATPTQATVARIQVSPSGGTLEVGEQLTLTASAFDDANTPLSEAEFGWTSRDASIASVSSGGVVTAVGEGTVGITAAAGPVQSTVSLTIEAPPPPTPPSVRVASVSVNPSSLSLVEGQTETIRAIAQSSSGARIGGRTTTWSSTDQSVVTVSSSGQVRAVAAGSATISVTIENQRANVAVTVAQQAVGSVAVTPASRTLDVGQTVSLSARLMSEQGIELRDRMVTWETSDASVATVSSDGTVTARGGGAATIEAVANDRRGGATITVRQPVVEPAGPTAEESERQIRSLIADWGTALESRRVENLLRANPGMTREQQQSWSDFLGSVQTMDVRLDVTNVSITGNSAVANIAARYDYAIRGRRQTQEPSLVAQFTLDGTQWRMTSIR